MLQLSPLMQKWVRLWIGSGHKLDERLLVECAYYPRGGCQNCSWDTPRPECQWSHILIDSRIDPSEIRSVKKKKVRSVFGKDLEELMKQLTPSDRMKVEEILRGGERG